MTLPPKLTLPTVRLRVSVIDGVKFVWDSLRGKWLVLTSEERVRRRALAYLETSCGVPSTSLAQEFRIDVNSQSQRADIVAFDSCGRPFILVECKEREVPITEEVLAQASRYNSVVGAPYVMLTNGDCTLFFEFTGQGYRPILTPPTFR